MPPRNSHRRVVPEKVCFDCIAFEQIKWLWKNFRSLTCYRHGKKFPHFHYFYCAISLTLFGWLLIVVSSIKSDSATWQRRCYVKTEMISNQFRNEACKRLVSIWRWLQSLGGTFRSIFLDWISNLMIILLTVCIRKHHRVRAIDMMIEMLTCLKTNYSARSSFIFFSHDICENINFNWQRKTSSCNNC